jgi:hypothetical protein
MTEAIPQEALEAYRKRSALHDLAVDLLIESGRVQPVEQSIEEEKA